MLSMYPNLLRSLKNYVSEMFKISSMYLKGFLIL